MTDLFGDDRREPVASLRPVEPSIRLSLFDHAAEQTAIRSGRPLSQERAEIVSGAAVAALAGRLERGA